jgi:DNA polymerase-1
MPSLYLIDAHAYLHRAYHALPPLTTSKGQPVGAIYGFMRMIMKIEKQHKPDYMAVCFDTAAPTFRHLAYAEYKATRKETDAALVSQFPLAREAVLALNLVGFEKDGFEADDLIAHLTRQGRTKGWEVIIVTGDKDALQLIGDGVRVLNESKDTLYGPEQVKERYGVAPEQIPDMFALIGDASDNVPGVSGIGPKTAAKLIQDYGTLEAVLKAAQSITGKVGMLLQSHAQDALKSRSLVTLDHDVPMEIDWDKCRLEPPNAEILLPFLQKLEFQALLKDFAPASQAPVDTSERDYKTITEEKDLQEWVKRAAQAGKLALDTETTGLDPLQARLVGISLSYQKGTACYIPIGHQVLGGPRQLPLEVVRKHLAPLLRSGKPLLYGHNLKFDAEILSHHGLPLGQFHCDTMVASYVLNPSRNNHGLKDLALELLGEKMTSIDQLIGKGARQISMDAVSIDEASPYACADADMTLRLAETLEPQIQEKGLGPLFYEMEMPLVSILGQMEKTGIRIDRHYLETLGKDLRAQANTIEKEIYLLAQETFNINSPKQLAVILFEKLKLPVIRRTKTGFSTDEEVLQKLSSQHPLPKKLIDYRELQKLNSTYVDGLLAAMEGPEHRVHTSFNQTITATGRLSSSNPNLQNIPIRTELGRKIRKAFVPKEGWMLLSADYSQIDLRMLAHISEDKMLCVAFQKGEDVHTMTACEIFGVTAKDVTPELRRVAKSINFGIVYGMSAFGLSQQLNIPVEEAKAHIDRYFARYPGVKSWMGKIIEDARREGCVRTLLGRIRYLPEIHASNGAIRSFAERTAMNTPIQGTSADVIKLAMIKLVEAQADGLWKGNMLVQVHDELLFEIPPEHLAASQSKIKEIMENAIPLRIPVIVDLKAGKNWSQMTPVTLTPPLSLQGEGAEGG